MIYVFEKKAPSSHYALDYLKVNKDISEERSVNGLLNTIKVRIEPSKLMGKNITFSSPQITRILDKLRK